MSHPALRHRTPAAPALDAARVQTAVAVAHHNGGSHGVRGDADTVLAADSIGQSAVPVRHAAATFGGVRGVVGTVPAAAAIPGVRGVADSPVTVTDPLREAVSEVRGDADTPVTTTTTPAVASDPGGATGTANATALPEATDGAHPAVPRVRTLHSLVIRPLHRETGGDAMAAAAT